MRRCTVFAIGIFAWLATSSTASAEIQLTIQNGRVSLIAKDVTLRQILAEWARVGQTKIVNAERVPGGPVTLQLTDVAEEQALDTLLRPLSGYLAAPRATVVSNLSRFDRILVMPTVAQPLSAAVGTTAAQPGSVYPQPSAPVASGQQPAQPAQQPHAAAAAAAAEDQEDDRPAPSMPRSPVFNTFPQPVVNPAPQSAPTATPGMMAPAPNQAGQPPNVPAPAPTAYPGAPTTPYGGVSVPGMIVAPPQQPGQSNGIQPPKRPGGGNN